MEAVQSTVPAPPNPASRDEVLKSFNSENWLIELAGTVGVSINDIPLDRRQEILACKTKNWVNIKFFEWLKEKPAEGEPFTEEDKALFENLVSLRRSPQYEREKQNLESYLARVHDRFRDVRDNLEIAAKHRARMHELEGTKSIDLTEEIKKCVADGWYKYEPTLTREFNRSNSTAYHGIVFSTPPVIAKFYNKSAGVELDVNLGKFRVVYQPARNYVSVAQHDDNLSVSGHIHPHVGTQGDVCWGNAEETFVAAMNDCQPSRALLALRVILTNYNDESPFVSLYDFAVERHPNMLDDKPIVFVQTESLWVLTEELPDGVTGVREDSTTEDGEDITYVRVYHRVYMGTTRDVDDERIYYFKVARNGNYEYVEVDEHWVRD